MALIKCNHCGQPVSDRAIKCPHCGNNPKEVIEKPQVNQTEDKMEIEEQVSSSGANKGLVSVVVVLAIIAIGLGVYLYSGTGTGRIEPMPIDTVAVDSDAVESDDVTDTVAVEPEEEDYVSCDSITDDESYGYDPYEEGYVEPE